SRSFSGWSRRYQRTNGDGPTLGGLSGSPGRGRACGRIHGAWPRPPSITKSLSSLWHTLDTVASVSLPPFSLIFPSRSLTEQNSGTRRKRRAPTDLFLRYTFLIVPSHRKRLGKPVRKTSSSFGTMITPLPQRSIPLMPLPSRLSSHSSLK